MSVTGLGISTTYLVLQIFKLTKVKKERMMVCMEYVIRRDVLRAIQFILCILITTWKNYSVN